MLTHRTNQQGEKITFSLQQWLDITKEIKLVLYTAPQQCSLPSTPIETVPCVHYALLNLHKT